MEKKTTLKHDLLGDQAEFDLDLKMTVKVKLSFLSKIVIMFFVINGHILIILG